MNGQCSFIKARGGTWNPPLPCPYTLVSGEMDNEPLSPWRTVSPTPQNTLECAWTWSPCPSTVGSEWYWLKWWIPKIVTGERFGNVKSLMVLQTESLLCQEVFSIRKWKGLLEMAECSHSPKEEKRIEKDTQRTSKIDALSTAAGVAFATSAVIKPAMFCHLNRKGFHATIIVHGMGTPSVRQNQQKGHPRHKDKDGVEQWLPTFTVSRMPPMLCKAPSEESVSSVKTYEVHHYLSNARDHGRYLLCHNILDKTQLVNLRMHVIRPY
ncbi:hypothetical protein JB92DRAFT_2836086 [Gautieria morchelliformis]|nr:hypothetical protein JB92DRAFT_2836086 [Gautieria morchelliformis]